MLVGQVGGSASDPFTITEWGAQPPGYKHTAGRTQVSSVISVPASTLVIVTMGQSQFGTAGGTSAYTATNSGNHNFNIYDGAVYSAQEPALGPSYAASVGPSCINLRLADKIIDGAHATRAIMCPMAIGGSKIAQWKSGGNLYHRIQVMKNRLDARGYVPDLWLCAIGETDGVDGTSGASFTADYQAVVQSIRDLGVTAPFYAALSTYVSGENATIRTATQNAVSVPLDLRLGPDSDAIGNRLDGVHFNDTGLGELAQAWYDTLYP